MNAIDSALRSSTVLRTPSTRLESTSERRNPAVETVRDGYNAGAGAARSLTAQAPIDVPDTEKVSAEVADQTAFDLMLSVLGPPQNSGENSSFMRLHEMYSRAIENGKLDEVVNHLVSHPRFQARLQTVGASDLVGQINGQALGTTAASNSRIAMDTNVALRNGNLADRLFQLYTSDAYGQKLADLGVNFDRSLPSTQIGSSGPSNTSIQYPTLTKGNFETAAEEAADWVRKTYPQLFPIDRDGEAVMRKVVDALKANGYNAGRNVIDGRENLAAGDMYRYGSDVVIDGDTRKIYDLYLSGNTAHLLPMGVSRNGIVA